MRTLITMLLICALTAMPALASGIDWESMTDQEISTALAEGKAVLDARSGTTETGSEGEVLLCDYEGFKVVLTDVSLTNDYGTEYLNLEYLAENASDLPHEMFIEFAYINDWQTSMDLGMIELEPGKKSKGAFQLEPADSGITDIADVQSIEIQFRVGSTNADWEQIPLFTYRPE